MLLDGGGHAHHREGFQVAALVSIQPVAQFLRIAFVGFDPASPFVPDLRDHHQIGDPHLE